MNTEKNRVIKVTDGNGKSVFYAQYFNEYKGWRIFKFLETDPNEWVSYSNFDGIFSHPKKFNSFDEAFDFLKSLESTETVVCDEDLEVGNIFENPELWEKVK
jgi:hypothetical protein